MANLNAKLKKILTDLENKIQDKEDLEYVKTQIFNLYNLFFEEVSNNMELSNDKIMAIIENQANIERRIEKIEKTVKNMEDEFYMEDDCSVEITCPYCNKGFTVEEDELKDEIQCPECNNIIELDWGECDCGDHGCNCEECGHCDDNDEDM